MDKNKAMAIIEETFDNKFDKELFVKFIRNLLNDIDASENKYREYRGNLIRESFRTHITQYTRIGKYTDPNGIALDVLAIEVQDDRKLDKARTSLRNFVIDHLQKFEKDYALAAFYSKTDGKRNWRFSFVKLEHHTSVRNGKIKQEKEFTPARRYSFLVGEDEKSHTAKRQLLPLLQNVYNNPTIEDIEKAFSIEVVTDEFFGQYKELYLRLSEYLDADNQVKSVLETAGTDIPRFTKKLLGQIVFLYFLQKKGWMGVPQNDKWGNGQKNFLQSLYNKAEAEGSDFFNSCLRYLFYEALARQHGEDNYYARLDCRIPFLNGGLFEANYDWETTEINLPNRLFRNNETVGKTGDVGTGVLDVFDRYNFTIREDEPLEKEVAIDPEMLGKVFENMLEITERKSKGAFYTPREIVHYMCQESLIHYLETALNNSVSRNEIEDFVRNSIFYIEHDARVADRGKETETYTYRLPESIRRNANLIDRLLTNIKICDPAIGSGAFPVGLLNELVTLQQALRSHLSQNYLSQKLQTIGLRAEDYHRNPEKYLYRVKRHNIQESIYGVDIDASAIDIARLRLWLSLVVDEEDFDNIEALPNLDYKIVCGNSLVGFPDNWNSPAFERIENLKDSFFTETEPETKKKYKNEIDFEISDRLYTSKKIFGYQVDFDFKLFFSEVWHENGGFDIVIGNPPYISTKGTSTEDKRIFEKIYSFADDTYNHFFFRGIPLLSTNGSLTFITPKTFWTTQTKRNLRNLLLTKQILYVFDTANPFSAAMVDTCITSISARKTETNQLKFLDGSKDLIHPVSYSINQSVYLNTQNSVIFKPTDENLKIYRLFGQKVKDLYNRWWDKIKTSRDIELNKHELKEYRKSLKPGDFTLLGCLTEGGVGLQTGNNGKYIAVRKTTKWAKNILESRPKKLSEAIKAKKIPLPEMANFANTADYLASLTEKEIAALFDSLKERYGRDIFGQGYIYRLIDDREIANVDELTDDEKKNGILETKPCYVPYDKGDKDGNRWYLETPFAIEWSQKNVGFLKADSNARYQGYMFYFKEGFCWSLINGTRSENDLKFRLSTAGVYDVGGMSLHSVIENIVSQKYIVCIGNSNIISRYTESFINFTVNFQINDARQLPIIIPSKEQLLKFEILFNSAIEIKMKQFSNQISMNEAESQLRDIQEKLDKKVYELYYSI
ncbi:MAG: Eco57I restriction-modification methylase domain-containing protein [Tannerella sp.]|jgi:23S rRNA G2445 N2-methylase RlmL|nr:Eco57I restriction-modification methylase domain-containing protein [Tannerella sp.]